MDEARAAVALGGKFANNEQSDAVARQRASIRYDNADGETRKIRITPGCRPFILTYRLLPEGEPRELISSIDKDGVFLVRIDKEQDPVLFALMDEYGFKDDVKGKKGFPKLKFEEMASGGNFSLVTSAYSPNILVEQMRRSFFDSCCIESGRLVTSEELAENAKKAKERQSKKNRARVKASMARRKVEAQATSAVSEDTAPCALTVQPATKGVNTETAEIPQPAVSQPEIPQPAIPQPAIPQPAVTQPEVTQPEIPQPAVSQPEIPQPAIPQPEIPQPAIPQPEVTQPEIPQPAVTQPEVTQPEIPQPEVTQPTVTQPVVSQPTTAALDPLTMSRTECETELKRLQAFLRQRPKPCGKMTLAEIRQHLVKTLALKVRSVMGFFTNVTK